MKFNIIIYYYFSSHWITKCIMWLFFVSFPQLFCICMTYIDLSIYKYICHFWGKMDLWHLKCSCFWSDSLQRVIVEYLSVFSFEEFFAWILIFYKELNLLIQQSSTIQAWFQRSIICYILWSVCRYVSGIWFAKMRHAWDDLIKFRLLF